MSPLASFPPTPTTRWVLLADGSGSMAQGSGGMSAGVSSWAVATSAIIKLLPGIPPADPVQIGQFSQDVKWWLPAGSAADAAGAALPPADAYPHGPTNLEAALNQVADDSNGEMRTELILLSDCDATISHPDILMDVLARKQIRLHVLAIANGSALGIIRRRSHSGKRSGEMGAVAEKIIAGGAASAGGESAGHGAVRKWGGVDFDSADISVGPHLGKTRCPVVGGVRPRPAAGGILENGDGDGAGDWLRGG
jgi:hypothetical protein